MEAQARYDIFEEGDQTALVCIDDPEVQEATVAELTAVNYKIHTGLFPEDVALKLRTHNYSVVVVYESFNGSDLETNQVLKEVINVPAEQRRHQFIILVGPNMVTNDEMQAFICSVDLTFSLSDLPNLKTVLRRAVARHREFYSNFIEALRISGMD
ncbi:MAG: hypothetical protein WCD79_07790 [Chthoniobacteraceae bacterium]